MTDIVARLREAMKAKALELPYMSKDVDFFGVTDDEWNELLAVVIAPLRAERDAANAQLEEAREQIDVERYERDELRELLREARPMVGFCYRMFENATLPDRIDAALGHKNEKG